MDDSPIEEVCHEEPHQPTLSASDRASQRYTLTWIQVWGARSQVMCQPHISSLSSTSMCTAPCQCSREQQCTDSADMTPSVKGVLIMRSAACCCTMQTCTPWLLSPGTDAMVPRPTCLGVLEIQTERGPLHIHVLVQAEGGELVIILAVRVLDGLPCINGERKDGEGNGEEGHLKPHLAGKDCRPHIEPISRQSMHRSEMQCPELS